jgi:hypothetical protein
MIPCSLACPPLGSAFLTADVVVSKGSDCGTIMTGRLTAALGADPRVLPPPPVTG